LELFGEISPTIYGQVPAEFGLDEDFLYKTNKADDSGYAEADHKQPASGPQEAPSKLPLGTAIASVSYITPSLDHGDIEVTSTKSSDSQSRRFRSTKHKKQRNRRNRPKKFRERPEGQRSRDHGRQNEEDQ